MAVDFGGDIRDLDEEMPLGRDRGRPVDPNVPIDQGHERAGARRLGYVGNSENRADMDARHPAILTFVLMGFSESLCQHHLFYPISRRNVGGITPQRLAKLPPPRRT
jgi:hypothetical protein